MPQSNYASFRDHWVDCAKTIGILLVVFGHEIRGLFGGNAEFPYAFLRVVDSAIYSFHMPLFFFLSGLFFLTSFSHRGFGNLLVRKLDTIFYPYILWSLFQGGLEVYLNRYIGAYIAPYDVFLLLWQPRAQFWFLYTLFLFFVFVIGVFSFLFRRNALSGRAVVSGFVLSVVAYIVSSMFPEAVEGMPILGYVTQNFVFFYLGIIFSLRMRKNIDFLSKRRVLIVLALLFVVGQIGFHLLSGLCYSDYGVRTLLLAIVSIFFVVSFSISISSRVNGRWGGWFIMLGASSVAIYLMHIMTSSIARVFIKEALGIEFFSVHLFVGCFFGLSVPVYAFFLVRKYELPFVFSFSASKLINRN